ncbi:uncharacterized protein PAC_01488 [Phialocephala subalpina]|uniref:AB hydrolase-1 domain-containing protein n=1 Tax=Phialocephala subalpina TaxID=576137 RepID=A0A1L7WFS3_9HELO|nr:uncharacterized protein PAC_01488 [Phialocephala subalpina]
MSGLLFLLRLQSRNPLERLVLWHIRPPEAIRSEFIANTSIPVTIIAIDRTGIGLSSFLPSRKITDWPSDVLALVDHLKIERFHVVGGSGGSPYALVCLLSSLFPRTRLLNVAVVSGIYPLSLGTEGLLFPIKLILYGGAWLPLFTRKFLDLEFGGAVDSREEFERKFMKAMESRLERDLRRLDDLPFRRMMIDRLGFSLSDLEIDGGGAGKRRAILWHGKGDVNAPVQMAEKASKLMKGSELRVVEGETHLMLVRIDEERVERKKSAIDPTGH